MLAAGVEGLAAEARGGVYDAGRVARVGEHARRLVGGVAARAAKGEGSPDDDGEVAAGEVAVQRDVRRPAAHRARELLAGGDEAAPARSGRGRHAREGGGRRSRRRTARRGHPLGRRPRGRTRRGRRRGDADQRGERRERRQRAHLHARARVHECATSENDRVGRNDTTARRKSLDATKERVTPSRVRGAAGSRDVAFVRITSSSMRITGHDRARRELH